MLSEKAPLFCLIARESVRHPPTDLRVRLLEPPASSVGTERDIKRKPLDGAMPGLG
jgi:hypothetical protein